MLTKIDEKLYRTGWYIYYPLYILSLVGFRVVAPKYLSYFTAAVKVYISLLLFWKFNPLRKPKPVSSYDREIIFSAAVFLLLTTIIGDLIISKDSGFHEQLNAIIKGIKLVK